MTRSERTLWRRWVERRDGEAFAQLVRRHARFVYDFARRVAGNAADAEDLTQEAYLKLAEAKPDEPDQVGLRAFLGRRVVLGARMLKRAALARRRHESQVLHPGGAGGPEEVARHEQAEKALAVLPDGERRAVQLRFLHDLSYGEIAAVLGTTEEAARMRVHRGLERMRARFCSSACLAALALFEPPARMLASTAKTALLTGGVVVAQATGKKAAILVGLALLLGLLSTAAIQVASENREEDAAVRARPRSLPDNLTAQEPKTTAPGAVPTGPTRITGVVVDAEGAPIAGATVRVYRHERVLEGSTDDRGAFGLDVGGEHKQWFVEARHPAYVTCQAPASVDADVRLVLEAGVEVRVEVLGSGRPLAGARVAATGDDVSRLDEPGYLAAAEGLTDDTGTTDLHVAVGRCRIWVGAAGWAPKLADPVVCAVGQPQVVRVELETGGHVDGSVLDAAGQPVAGARVVVRAHPGFRRTTTTARDGEYSFDHVPLGSPYWLQVVADHPAHVAASASRMWTAGDGDRMRFDLVFGKPARLPGVVLDASGKPLPGRLVALVYGRAFFHLLYGNSWTDGYPFVATTDEAGRFELSGLPAGAGKLYLQGVRLIPVEVELVTGRTHAPVELRVPEAAVKGRVFDADGKPVAGASVHVGTSGSVGTDAEGRFELMDRPQEIVVCAEAHVPVRHAVDGTEFEVRLPAATLSGTVTTLDGRAATSVAVAVRTKEGYPGTTQADERGRFRFRGAGGDEYSVGVHSRMGLELIGPDLKVTGPRDDLVLVVLTPDEAERRRVRGTVVDEANLPIDAPVAVATADRRWWGTEKRAGQAGGFVCRALEPKGEMRLVFAVTGYLESEPVDVRLDGKTPIDPITVRLRRGAEAEVTVCEEDGTPVPGAFVYCYTDQGVQGTTGPDGRCVLAGLPTGRWRITVSHAYITDTTDAFAEATSGARQAVEIRGKVAGLIAMRLPPDTRAEKSVVLRLQDSAGRTVSEERFEKARLALMERNKWTYDFSVTAPGTYRIRCEVDGVPLPEAEIEARLRETTEVEFKPAR